MPRRRSVNGETPETPLEVTTESPSEPRLSVRMEGTADQVKKQLGVTPDQKPEEKKPEVPVEDFENFSKLLKNPKFNIKVKRLRPKQWNGTKTSVEVWTSELPLQWEEIKQEVNEIAKGGTYKVSVINPDSGSVIDARNFEIDGDPFVPSTELTPEEKAMFGQTPPEETAAAITEKGLEQTARMTARQIEVERLTQTLKELRGDHSGKRRSVESDSRIEDLERRLTVSQHQVELEARDRKHDEELKELRALIAQGQKTQKQDGPSETSLILQQMQRSQDASDKRHEAILKQMQDDKMNAVLEELRSIKNKPSQQGNTMLENLEAMVKIKKLMGWGGDDDDDEEDDKDDDRPWWERALDRLGDKITPKLVDKIFDRLDGIEKGGKTVDRDQFLKTIDEEKKKEDELVRLATDQAIAKLNLNDSKNTEQKPVEKVPVVDVMERKVVGEEKPAPQAAAATEAPPAPAPVEEKAGQDQLEVKKQICQRVANVIMLLESELEQRPRQYDWNYEGCWKMLPESILEKVCTAKTQAEVFDAFKVEGINTAEIDKLKEKVMSNPRAAAWVSRGIRELNLWWLKLEEDPEFDPADEGEAEEKEEQPEGAGL